MGLAFLPQECFCRQHRLGTHPLVLDRVGRHLVAQLVQLRQGRAVWRGRGQGGQGHRVRGRGPASPCHYNAGRGAAVPAPLAAGLDSSCPSRGACWLLTCVADLGKERSGQGAAAGRLPAVGDGPQHVTGAAAHAVVVLRAGVATAQGRVQQSQQCWGLMAAGCGIQKSEALLQAPA